MKNILSLTLAVLFALHLSAQNTDLQKAFKNSYLQETKGDLPAAIKELLSVYSETSYELNLRLGWLHYSSGLFTPSITYYGKAMELMPASIEAKLGYVYPASSMGNWDQVQKQYEDILRIDAKNTQAQYRLGLLYYGKEQFDKALLHFQVGFNLYPFDYDFTLMMAWTSFKMGKLREAKVLFSKVLLISPDDASALEGLSLIQ